MAEQYGHFLLNCGLEIPALPSLRHWKGKGVPPPWEQWESEKLSYFTNKQATCLLGLSFPSILDTWLTPHPGHTHLQSRGEASVRTKDTP